MTREDMATKIDWITLGIESKSHRSDDLEKAFVKGETIWIFDSCNDGLDDVLIGKREEIESDLLCYTELSEIPCDWNFREMDPEDLIEEYPV